MESEEDRSAQRKVQQFLAALVNLTPLEKEEAMRVFSLLHDTITSSAVGDTWAKVSGGEVRTEVFTAAAALLTVYLQEFIALVEREDDDQPPKFHRRFP